MKKPEAFFLFVCFVFLRPGFSVALELALVDQAGLEFTEISLPLHSDLLGLKVCVTTARQNQNLQTLLM